MKDIHHIHNLMLFDSPNINLRGCEQSCQFRFRPPFRFAPKMKSFGRFEILTSRFGVMLRKNKKIIYI